MGSSPFGGGDALQISEVHASGVELSHAQTQLSSALDIRAAHSFFQTGVGNPHLPPIPGMTSGGAASAQMAFRGVDFAAGSAAHMTGQIGTAAISSAPMAHVGDVAVHVVGKLGEGAALAAANAAGSQTISPLVQMIMRMPGHLGLFSSFFEALSHFFIGHDILTALDPTHFLEGAAHALTSAGETAAHALGSVMGHLSDLVPHDLGLHLSETLGQAHSSLLTASESGLHSAGVNGVHFSEPVEDLQHMTNASGYADAGRAQFEHIPSNVPPIPGFAQPHYLLSDATSSAFRPTIGNQPSISPTTSTTPSPAASSGVVNMQPLHITAAPQVTPSAPVGHSSLLSRMHSMDGNGFSAPEPKHIIPEEAIPRHNFGNPSVTPEIKPHFSEQQASAPRFEQHQAQTPHIEHHQTTTAQGEPTHAPQAPIEHHQSPIESANHAATQHAGTDLTSPAHMHLKPQSVVRAMMKQVTAPASHPQHLGSTMRGASQYSVRSGDTLWKIARDQLGGGGRWSDIYKANQGLIGSNPSMLHQGMKLNLPDGSSNYTVHSGDSLWSISQNHLGGGTHWPSLYHANEAVIGSNPGVLHPGQHLAFPHGSLIHPEHFATVAHHIAPHQLLTHHIPAMHTNNVASSFSESFHPLRAHALMHTPTLHQPVSLATNSVHVGGSEISIGQPSAPAPTAPAVHSAPASSGMPDSVKMTHSATPQVSAPSPTQNHSLFWRPELILQQHQ